MGNFDVSEPMYNNELKKLTKDNPGHADTFNPLFQQLLENDEVLRKEKAGIATASVSSDGLMSSGDKSKLDDIDDNANNYTHPDSHPVDIIDTDDNHQFVSKTEKIEWSAKADRSKFVLITISANAWKGDSIPYSYTITDPDITAINMIDITYRSGVTKEVTDAWDGAEIKRYLQSDGELTLYADSEKPTIDIPLNMIIRGDL